MPRPDVHAAHEPQTPTVNPQAVNKSKVITHNLHQSKRFNPEEWENWMQWDGAADALSPKSLGDEGGGSVNDGSLSNASTSPSEAESLRLPPLTPVYQIPSIDEGQKLIAPNISQEHQPSSKKRKTSARPDTTEATRTRQPKGQKISHNVIEKRYRTNLNDKIARLRDSVPVLKSAFEQNQKQTTKQDVDSGSEESGSEDKASLLGLKFNKATVLTKATEYIEQLEKVNARLSTENNTLRRRVRDGVSDVNAPKPLFFRADEANATGNSMFAQATSVEFETAGSTTSQTEPDNVSGKIPVAAEFQRLRAEAADQPSYAPTAPTPESLSPAPTALETETVPSTPATVPSSELIDFDSVKGSIPVPDYISRNRIPISQQQHYAPPADGRRDLDPAEDTFILDDEEPRAWWPRHRAAKLLLGSLAGLMIMEGFNANVETATPAPPSKHAPHPKRGMNFLPSDFYTESRGFRAQIRQRIIDFANSPRGRSAVPIILLAAIVLLATLAGLFYWSRNDTKGRRRTYSSSSHLESEGAAGAGDRSVEVKPSSGFLSVPTKTGLSSRNGSLTVSTSKRRRDFFSETVYRLRGCWHILTTGETSDRDYEEK